jgi:energy-coupling factor transport system permease protein
MRAVLAYRDSGSPLHRWHPFVLCAWAGVVVVSALLFQHPAFLVVLCVVTAAVALAARVVRPWWSVVRYSVWMGLAIVLINVVVSNEGAHVLLRAGFRLPLLGVPTVTLEALAFGGAMALRLAAIISAFTLLNLCVHPDELMRAAIKLRLPYRSVLVTSLSTRFVPVLMQDAQTISDVQRSRGLEFDRGGLSERIRNRGALILPLLSNSLDRAVQVAEAMESRAYGAAARRTFLHDVKLSRADAAALIVMCLALAAGVGSYLSGAAAYSYYPALRPTPLGLAGWLWLAGFGAAVLAVIPLSLALRRTGQ